MNDDFLRYLQSEPQYSKRWQAANDFCKQWREMTKWMWKS